MKRRDFLSASGSIGLLSSLIGCVSSIPTLCLDRRLLNPDTPLVVDAHSHIFNATDLPVRNFITKVVARDNGLQPIADAFGGILQVLGWNSAPTVAEERKELQTLKQCTGDEQQQGLLNLREAVYADSVIELREAAERELARMGIARARMNDLTSLSDTGEALRGIYQLPDRYDQYVNAMAGPQPLGLQNKSLSSAIAFFIEMFQYRTTSVFNYLSTYNKDAAMPVDLLIAALVDFDWWISDGEKTPSSLPDQVKLMGDIAEATAGRTHMLVPFCPFRQVVTDTGIANTGFSPMKLVRDAVEKYGAVGVKLYPPMGFAPFGNTGLDLWADKKLPAPSTDPDFGQRLDDALRQLYGYCEANGVAVMAHSSPSNVAHRDYLQLVDVPFFEQLATEFPRLNISLGHFGGNGSGTADTLDSYLDYLSHSSNRRYADASYFANVEDAPEALYRTLLRIYEHDQGRLASRLMYGSDWKMLAAESQSARYLQSFSALIERIERETGTGIMPQFLGSNAAALYDLEQGPARDRLEAFYLARDMDTPAWMLKV